MEHATSTVVNALQYLAGVCDGAQTRDGHGFNGADARFGHDLADKSKRWTLSPAQLYAALEMMRKYQDQLHHVGMELPDKAALEAEQKAKEQKAKEQERIDKPHGRVELIDNKTLIVYFEREFIRLHLQTVKDIPGRRWDGERNGWQLPISQLDAVAAAFPAFVYSPELAEMIRIAKRDQAPKADPNALKIERLLALGDLSQPLPDGTLLFNHQREGVPFMVERSSHGQLRGAINSDDPGLGKTLQLLMAAKAFRVPVIVICPPTLIDGWGREAERVQVQVEIFSWAKIPIPPTRTPYVLLCDESHLYQTFGLHTTDRKTKQPKVIGIKRTADMLRLALHENCRAVFHATATPMPNGRPSALYALLVSINHPLAGRGFEGKKTYEKIFCNAGPTRWRQWDTTGAANLDQLHHELQVGEYRCMIRRKKEWCIDLPPFTRLPPHRIELSSKAQKEYDKELDRLRAVYEEVKEGKRAALLAEMRDRLAALTDDLEQGLIDNEVFDEQAEEAEALGKKAGNLDRADALVMLGHICHVGSLAKLEATYEQLTEFFGSGNQAVVFCRFKDTVAHIVEWANQQRFWLSDSESVPVRATSITSETPNKQRQPLVDEFQAHRIQLIVCTFGAGGVGLTMTAASQEILHDRPWTPALVEQAEGRVHRIGSTESVFSHWMQLEADKKIDEILAKKEERIELVLDGKRKTMRGTGSVVQEAPRIVRQILGRK